MWCDVVWCRKEGTIEQSSGAMRGEGRETDVIKAALSLATLLPPPPHDQQRTVPPRNLTISLTTAEKPLALGLQK